MTEKPDFRIDYVELPAVDIAATKSFYSAAFGWSFIDYGPTYISIQGAGLDGGFEKGAPLPTRIHTGPLDEKNSRATSGSLVILYSANLEAALKAVEDAGGEIVRGIFDFPGGRRFHFLDPNGNELAVWSEPA